MCLSSLGAWATGKGGTPHTRENFSLVLTGWRRPCVAAHDLFCRGGRVVDHVVGFTPALIQADPRSRAAL